MAGGESGDRLFQFTGETYEGSFKADLMEQYKLYVQSAGERQRPSGRVEPLSADPQRRFGGSVRPSSANFGQTYWTLLVPVLGIPVSLLWHQIIKSHRDLNAVKFDIIHELERHLPAALFQHEWQLAGEGKGRSYNPVTYIERVDSHRVCRSPPGCDGPYRADHSRLNELDGMKNCQINFLCSGLSGFEFINRQAR